MIAFCVDMLYLLFFHNCFLRALVLIVLSKKKFKKTQQTDANCMILLCFFLFFTFLITLTVKNNHHQIKHFSLHFFAWVFCSHFYAFFEWKYVLFTNLYPQFDSSHTLPTYFGSYLVHFKANTRMYRFSLQFDSFCNFLSYFCVFWVKIHQF